MTNSSSVPLLDLAIIGGGPAGLSAGLYATRGGLKQVVLFEKGAPGGQITFSSEIENYPGVREIVSGLDFMQPWQEQCFRFGLRHEMALVTQVKSKGEHFAIHTDENKVFHARSVILATGGKPKRAGIKGEDTFWGNGVSTCATCDGFFYKNKEVAVLGGGDTALEEALYLAKICTKVYLVHRRDTFRAAPITLEKAQNNPKIEFITPAVIEEIKGDANGVNAVVFKNTHTGVVKELAVPGIFIFVGYEINNEVLKQEDKSMLCACDPYGAVVVDLAMKTSVKGFFAAGDVRTQAAKQVVCAAGDGATAALSAIAYLEGH
ncbi:Thioredoxin reductase TrxB [Helicobacter ailurogastricus]|uniref:Thioredoxin reductase n=1 Tax=Helicobacter ailurogastricus TaxID=1578720 RepID=A0A0K2X6E7_9HELI|nr:Thioredoxin reductase [Helicobacter ailurogastricus]CRF42082.1 Thioredoxin reductase [Helicobacter ailurogastricus]CRF44961.1 Thioredoxin reductase [Helicobacter ailurogastricus]CRF52949.1 Thioredoxin reductase [Helicobacter ailurogastricus]BDQ28413.1 thioredoxin reductase [Helicobacter ailurogastricus]